ncbi:MAG: 4-demethylwyosine synthase TYW1, partial [Candidatus Micrarchaeia archaeon]
CLWTKRSLVGKGTCYKEKFYGVDAHRCAQMSPAVAWCEQNCLHCWRPMEMFRPPTDFDGEYDTPEKIICDVINERKKLLYGFGGNKNTDKKKYDECLEPSHWAISLSGEATLYPYLPELIKKIRERPSTKTIFLVTNGQEPEMLERLGNEDALPTQLYISLVAPNKPLYIKLAMPFYKDGWERLMRSFDVWKCLKTRKVIRITHIKGINDSEECAYQFGNLIEKAGPDFVEVKSYMRLGYSKYRLASSNMPTMKDVEEFAGKILGYADGFWHECMDATSRIVLLKNSNSKYKTNIFAKL